MHDSLNGVWRDLGDGLVLRRATPADTEALIDLQAVAFGHESPQMLPRIGSWTRDLMSGEHPTFRPGDFTLVEDTRTGAAVSSLNLISQKWTYAGIEFGVGRPELVCTHPEYRDRGLVRAQFDVIHAWSAERGELVQAITGIPYYYRQYGYEMAMTLGGARSGSWWQVPALAEGGAEPYNVRPATESDMPFVIAMVGQGERRSLVCAVRDDALWRYELRGIADQSIQRMVFCVVETPGGEPAGLLVHGAGLWRQMQGVEFWESVSGVSWLAVAPSVLRYLQRVGAAYAAAEGKPCDGYMLGLGTEHPAYRALRDWLPGYHPNYAWYLRVPDLPAFVRRIAPALDARLAGSVAAGHSGELKISFYRDGLRLVFDTGRLAGVERWRPSVTDGGMAAFPGLTFTQLLFGYRTLEELRYAFPDCWADGDTRRALLEALFPKQPSQVWPIH